MQIAFRTDASLQIGTGHVVRCLTLANVLMAKGAQCHFITRKNTGPLLEMIREQGHGVHVLTDSAAGSVDTTLPPHAAWLGGDWQGDASETRKILEKIDPDWLVVDHYALDQRWESAAKPDKTDLMVIDDLADRPHTSTLLMDQNLGRQAGDYDDLVPQECRRLIGPQFALIRPEFAAKRAQIEKTPFSNRPDNWLACVGGLDPNNILGKIVDAWEMLPLPKPSLTLVVGAGSPHNEILTKRVSGLKNVTLHVQTANMADLMAGARLFIGTTGSISWERCCLGLPAIMGMTADNQARNLAALGIHGTGISIGSWQEITPAALAAVFKDILRQPEILVSMAGRAAQLVDGRGAERVAAALMAEQIQLRDATLDDAEQALSWRNAESTRRYSIDSSVISADTHKVWWTNSLQSTDRSLLIAQLKGRPVGVLRFDYRGTDATISVYINPALAGKGVGTSILCAGIEWCHRNSSQTLKLLADILPENKPSLAAFRKAGFVFQDSKWVYMLEQSEAGAKKS